MRRNEYLRSDESQAEKLTVWDDLRFGALRNAFIYCGYSNRRQLVALLRVSRSVRYNVEDQKYTCWRGQEEQPYCKIELNEIFAHFLIHALLT